VWSPSKHRWIAPRNRAFHRALYTMMLVRNACWGDQPDAASGTLLPWLPTEMMVDIFCVLFDLYHPD
jgi:hypothetical protein